MQIMAETRRRAAPRGKVAALEAELALREARLKELSHRVKNSFAILASLASLEASKPQAGCAESFNRLRGSVEAMALLYDRLAVSGPEELVDAASYLGEIYCLLAGSVEGVELELELEPLSLDPRRATALGLAANEMGTNAIKYAFADRRKGRLRVTLRREGGEISLAVEDDGPGFPRGFDPQRDGGFGLEFLALEARELGGELRLGSSRGSRRGRPRGARIELAFPG